ncbi:hypothetical protein QT381_04365 [Galbitalea sp. SE-J8]|uniref:hypothetical protein n=1 Tax=Galbitalea sp. SE-J8 TaxID=3054952 RepID=UPI00259C8A93|nr:hypothetical protein [Galbitalea sp. SE-J8]MDM4762238.1 hypothetical protein [Galbitalea sp. SE-J8]
MSSSDGAERPTTVSTDEVRVRRAPRYGAFIVVGGVLGFLVTLVLTSLFPADETVGFFPLLAYFSCFGIPAGVVVGAVVAIIVDRVTGRRARTVAAERATTEAAPLEGELED